MYQMYKCTFRVMINWTWYESRSSWRQLLDDKELGDECSRWLGLDPHPDRALTWEETIEFLRPVIGLGVSCNVKERRGVIQERYIAFETTCGEKRITHGNGTIVSVEIRYKKVEHVSMETLMRYPVDDVLRYIKDRWNSIGE